MRGSAFVAQFSLIRISGWKRKGGSWPTCLSLFVVRRCVGLSFFVPLSYPACHPSLFLLLLFLLLVVVSGAQSFSERRRWWRTWWCGAAGRGPPWGPPRTPMRSARAGGSWPRESCGGRTRSVWDSSRDPAPGILIGRKMWVRDFDKNESNLLEIRNKGRS